MQGSGSGSAAIAEAQRLKASGNDLLSSKRYADAIGAYSAALDLLPPVPADGAKIPAAASYGGPPLRSVLLSNRSFAHLSMGHPNEALADADLCASESPTWPKAHVRRANALLQARNDSSSGDRRRNALDAYDDAIAAARVGGGDDNRGVLKELRRARRKCERELRETGSSRLSPEVESMGCLLAIPEGATVSECRAWSVALGPASYDGEDERTGTPIHAEFPGDPAWPMVAVSHMGGTHDGPVFPLFYYIIGPCVLTKGCVKEIDDIFRPLACHACPWPDGRATRTCPFCAGACIPGRGESFTMVVHQLLGRSEVGFGQKLMMQLVCERCTRKYLRKAEYRVEEDPNFEMTINGKPVCDIDPLPRVRALTETAHAIKTCSLWNNASNCGLISSITLHVGDRFQRMIASRGVDMISQYGSGCTNTPLEANGEQEFFDSWVSRFDERAINNPRIWGEDLEASYDSPASAMKGAKDDSAPGRAVMGHQEFFIRQVARIADLNRALGRFWKKYGADFRLRLTSLSEGGRRSLARECGENFIETRVEHYNRRHSQYHHIEDPRPLVKRPFGTVPKHKTAFLPELGHVDLLDLFRDRTTEGKSWVAQDVEHVARLKKEGRLPKLHFDEKDGSYLCDYMGLKDPNIGPFIVMIGSKEPEYNATGTYADEDFMSPEQIIRTPEYRSLCEPFAEHVTIYSAVADGEVRDSLNGLLAGGAATCAVCYIYAAMRQVLLLEYLHFTAITYCTSFIDGFDPNEAKRWSHHATAACYVCSARTTPDGGKLFCCSKCQKVFYCSKEHQTTDWKRHKAESCVTSPNYVEMTASTNESDGKKKAKGKKKDRGKKKRR